MASEESNQMQGAVQLKIERKVFKHQEEFDVNFHKTEQNVKRNKISCPTNKLKNILFGLFPILNWLPKYSWKNQLFGDVMSGCTVAVMHIPQGMGYALLGGVSPIVGLYMAFFPVLTYVFLGTSHHISLGTFAVTSLMTGNIVNKYGSDDSNHTLLNKDLLNATTAVDDSHYTNIEVATVACLMVGLWQILMGILRLGAIGIILSDHLVSGFTTAAAVHVLMSQVKSLLGIKIPRFSGAFWLIRSTIAIFTALPSTRPAEVIISGVTITILAVHNDWLKPWYSKKIKFPMPIELIILVLGIIVSYFGHLPDDYKIITLNHIPTGFPIPQSPPYELMPRIIIDSIAVAIVAYIVSLSMAKIMAHKRGYEVSNNQELLAHGVSNVFGSFFSCMPVAASLSRSMLQESVGGETQLASVISCTLILIILLWIGPYFESLPMAILSSVIIVSLKGMFKQFGDFISSLKTSPLDSVVWMVTFLSVVIIDIDIGLAIGIVASITVLVYRGHRPYAATLGHLPGTEMHVDVRYFSSAVEVPGIKIIRWIGAIHFANCENFRHVIDSHLDPLPLLPINNNSIATLEPHVAPIKYLVFDCSALSFVDLSGSKVLTSLHSDLQKKGIMLVFSNCSEKIIKQLDRCKYFKKFSKSQIYPTIMDAVLIIQNPDSAIPVTSLDSSV